MQDGEKHIVCGLSLWRCVPDEGGSEGEKGKEWDGTGARAAYYHAVRSSYSWLDFD